MNGIAICHKRIAIPAVHGQPAPEAGEAELIQSSLQVRVGQADIPLVESRRIGPDIRRDGLQRKVQTRHLRIDADHKIRLLSVYGKAIVILVTSESQSIVQAAVVDIYHILFGYLLHISLFFSVGYAKILNDIIFNAITLSPIELVNPRHQLVVKGHKGIGIGIIEGFFR